MNINMMAIKTVTDCISMAEEIKAQASSVTSEKEYDNLYNQSALLLDKVNNALETGGYCGDSYQRLHGTKYIIGTARKIAETSALKHMQ